MSNILYQKASFDKLYYLGLHKDKSCLKIKCGGLKINWTYAWIGLKKFIPASDYILAVEVARRLQNDGFTPVINLLGERCANLKKVERIFKQYIYIVDALWKAEIKGKISVKPNQLGLSISKEIYCERVIWLSRRAHNQKISIEVDTEDSKHLNDILEIFKKIPGEYNVKQRGISNNSSTIQTFYGIGDDLKKKWRDEGFRVEVYVPIGPWHKALPYIWRRMKKMLTKFLTCLIL